MSKQATRQLGRSRKGAGSSSSSSSLPAAAIRGNSEEQYAMHEQQQEAEVDTRKRKAASSSTSNKKRTKLKNEVEVGILESSSSGSSSAVATMKPAAQSSSASSHTNFPLYNDVLSQVIKYMNIHELHTAVQISKQWHEVVRKTKPLNLVSDADFMYMDLPLVNSALAIHIADAEYLGSKLKSNPSAVYEVALRFPNLTSIGPGLDITTELLQEDKNNGLTLPPLLRSFETRVHIFCLGPLAMALRPLIYLRELTIGISLFDDGGFQKTSHIDFSCFLPHCRPHLTKFELHFHGRSDDSSKPLSDSLVEFIRHCSTLSELNLWTDEGVLPRMYDQITEDPSAPLLKSGSLTTVQSCTPYHLSLSLLQSMVKFPSLKILNPGFIKLHARDMTLLSRFPHLTDLNLSGFSPDSTVEAMIAACKNCPQLRVLQISHPELTTANLRDCLAPLTNLTQLRIVDCPQLKDLAPLLECDLPLRLTELEVRACRLPVSVLSKQIFLLSNLRSLICGSRLVRRKYRRK